MTTSLKRALVIVTLVAAAAAGVAAQVPAERLLRAAAEPANWLIYSGSYMSQRYSALTQITRANVGRLQMQWILQATTIGSWQATPIVADGIMYVTQRPNDIVALDAATGRVFWTYKYIPAQGQRACCGANNRGLALLGDTLFMGTLDGHVVAVDANTGHLRWNTELAKFSDGYSVTLAPLVVKDKVIVGMGGAEYGIRGFITALDAATGKEAWRFYTIPSPDEPGGESWPKDDVHWRHGGGSVWVTGSYDPSLNLTYWGVGNPGPDYNAAQRPGDNLYANSVVAIDPDTGTLKWHFQFTPNDRYDWDATQVPVLVDRDWNGTPAKLMLWANRNGFFYVLDRVTGKFLLGKPFVKVNWATGLDANGRPRQTPQPDNEITWPGIQGGTNWYSPSYSPRTGLFYASVWEDYKGAFRSQFVQFEPGRGYGGGGFRMVPPVPDAPVTPNLRRGPMNTWTDALAHGAVIAIDPVSGERKWTYSMYDVTDAGVLTTASDLLFTGNREGWFQALDARTGELLWRTNLGAQINSAPITYEVGGTQYVSVAAGTVTAAFAIRP